MINIPVPCKCGNDMTRMDTRETPGRNKPIIETTDWCSRCGRLFHQHSIMNYEKWYTPSIHKR